MDIKIETFSTDHQKKGIHKWWHNLFWQRDESWDYSRSGFVYKKVRGYVCEKCGYEYIKTTYFTRTTTHD